MQCLDAIKIAANALPLAQLKSIFPTVDGANANANSYVNFLKNGDNTVTKGLKVGWPDFFNDDGTLKNSISVNGTVTDCKADASGCYNQFKAFIQTDAAAKKHVAEDGVTLWNTFRKDRELEQATARINICAAAIGVEKDDADRKAQIASCTEVKDQIVALSTGLLKDAKVAGTGAIQCSSYGLGPGTRTCDGSSSGTTAAGTAVAGETTVAGSNADGSTTVSNDRGLGGSAATIGMASLAILVALAAQL